MQSGAERLYTAERVLFSQYIYYLGTGKHPCRANTGAKTIKNIFRVRGRQSTTYFFSASSEGEVRIKLATSQFWCDIGDENIEVTPVHGDREGILSAVMAAMPDPWRYRWCESGACGCLGCSNRSGSLAQLGFERKDWEAWIAKNPDPSAGVDYDQVRENLIMALSTKH